MHENKLFFYFLFFIFLTKTRYFNIGFVSLQYKNKTNIDQSAVKLFGKSQIFLKKIFFGNNFEENFIFIYFFRAGPSPARVAGLDPASPAWSLAPASDQNPTIHARVMFYACMNSAKVINLPSHWSSPSCRWHERKKNRCCNR
jgi:hypothetical protein